MQLSIVIVNFNTSKLLHNCLGSVYASLTPGLRKNAEVIVVDNASTDDSCETAREEFPQVLLIRNKKNIGFAKANNQGMKASKGSYILLLNSDTKVANGALEHLVVTAQRDEKIGVVGGQLRNSDTSIQPSAGYFPNSTKIFFWMSFIDDIPLLRTLIKPYHVEYNSFYKREHEVDWVTGACFLLRREVFDHLGGFDEQIFMYGEEVEWCFRIKKAGYKVIYTPDSIVYHLKGGSGEGIEAGIIQEIQALVYFYKKHKPSWQQRLVPLFFKFGALLRCLLFGIIVSNPKKARLYAQMLTMAG